MVKPVSSKAHANFSLRVSRDTEEGGFFRLLYPLFFLLKNERKFKLKKIKNFSSEEEEEEMK